MVKQVIVVRKDLNMRKGKIAAQVGHAVMKIFFDRMKEMPFMITDEEGYYSWMIRMSPEMEEYKEGAFTKICVSVNSEKELLDINKQAEDAGLLVSLIQDAGKTEFSGVPTFTCLAIGPNEAEDIDKITGELPLL